MPELDVAMRAVRMALEDSKLPHRRLAGVQAEVRDAERAITNAISEFNRLRLETIAQSIVEEGLGWCMSGRHLAAEAELLGMVETGKYWTGDHYYEREESYTKVFTVCRQHAEALGQQHRSSTSRRNLVSLDIRKTWVEAITKSWPRELNAFVAEHAIPEPIDRQSLAR